MARRRYKEVCYDGVKICMYSAACMTAMIPLADNKSYECLNIIFFCLFPDIENDTIVPDITTDIKSWDNQVCGNIYYSCSVI